MDIHQLLAEVRKLVGNRYCTVEHSIRVHQGVARTYWRISVELAQGAPLFTVSEAWGKDHDPSSAESTLDALKRALTPSPQPAHAQERA